MKIFCALCAVLFGFLAYLKSSPYEYVEGSGWPYSWLVTYSMTSFTALISCIRPFPNWSYFSGSVLSFLDGILRLLNNTDATNDIAGLFLVSVFFVTLALAKWNIKPIA